MTRQYIGARYVPKFFENQTTGDSSWLQGVSYESLTIVTYNGNSYTSKKPVPAGIGSPNTNNEYWCPTGNYNAQLQTVLDDMDTLDNKMNIIKEDLVNLRPAKNCDQINIKRLGGYCETTRPYVAMQGFCMISSTTGIIFYESQSNGGKFRIMNMTTGAYTDTQTDIVSHGNSLTFTGDKLIMTAYYNGQEYSKILVFDDMTDLTQYREVDLSGSGISVQTITRIAYNDGKLYTVSTGNIETSGVVIGVFDVTDFSLIEEHTVKILSGTGSDWQDITCDDKYMYFIFPQHVMLVLSLETYKFIKVYEINDHYINGFTVGEIEGIDVVDGVFYVNSRYRYNVGYSQMCTSFGMFDLLGSARYEPNLHGVHSLYCDGTVRYDANGTVDKPYSNIMECLSVDEESKRRLFVDYDVENLILVNEDLVITLLNAHTIGDFDIATSHIEFEDLAITGSEELVIWRSTVNINNASVHSITNVITCTQSVVYSNCRLKNIALQYSSKLHYTVEFDVKSEINALQTYTDIRSAKLIDDMIQIRFTINNDSDISAYTNFLQSAFVPYTEIWLVGTGDALFNVTSNGRIQAERLISSGIHYLTACYKTSAH